MEYRNLGKSGLQVGICGPTTVFFEITESELIHPYFTVFRMTVIIKGIPCLDRISHTNHYDPYITEIRIA